MANFGPLAAEIGSGVWVTPANFNGFRILPSLLQRCRSPEADQTAPCLAISCAGTLYIHFRGLLPHDGILPGAKFTLRPSRTKSCVLMYWQRYCTALEHRASAKLCGVVQGMELQNLCRGCHLYLAGQTSRWALAHISSCVRFSFPVPSHPLPSNRHHRNSGNCLEGKRENYQVCSVQYCVQ